jgi:hypothetical protein
LESQFVLRQTLPLKISETERSEVMIFSPQWATGKFANPK